MRNKLFFRKGTAGLDVTAAAPESRMKKYGFLGISFLLPMILMALHYASMDVWPFGESSVLVLDLNGQYVYYFEAFRDIVREGGSILYSWSRALGGEFMGIFAYYLASPFSLITALFPEGCITEALLTIILLKVGCCGFTMAFYLNKAHNSKGVKTVIISTMYALSAYVVVQSHNTMWIDALIYLPLLTYAIEQLIKKGRFKMFVIVLALAMMANYYIGYMICIYTAVYFFYYYFATKEHHENNFYYENCHFIKSLIRIAAASVIAVAIAAWVLYPAYYSLTFGKTTFSDPDYSAFLKFSPLDMISKLFFGSYDTVEPSGLPFVYCGTLMLLLLPLYFFSNRVSARKKIAGGILLSAFAVSFVISSLDIAWHGFQNPNWLNYRYSFMFIFIALVFSHKVLVNIEKENFKYLIAAGVIWVLVIFIVHKQGYEHIGMSAVVGTVAAIAALLLALHAVRYGYLENGGILILAVIVCVELFCSALLTTQDLDTDVVISTRDSYNSFIDRVQPIVDDIKESDPGFYRMEKTVHRKTNDNLTLGIKGLSNSTSTLNASQIELLRRMGYSSKSHWSKYLGATPVSDSIFGLKYIITESQISNGLYNIYDEDIGNTLYAYENPYALSIAYGVNDKIKDLDFSKDYNNPFELMNSIVTAMLGEEERVTLFKELPLDNTFTTNLTMSYVEEHLKYVHTNSASPGRITYCTTAATDANVYMYVPTDYPRETKLKINSHDWGTCLGNESWRVIDIGKHNEGESINASLTLEEDRLYISDDELHIFYYFDAELFKEVMPKLQLSSYEVTEHSADRLYGSVDIAEGQTTLFTTIPYDEGWKVTVDGKEVKTFMTLDCLMALDIAEGEHTIEFIYRSDAVVHGAIFSIAGVVLFAAVCVAEHFIRAKERKRYMNSVDISR